MIKYKDLSVVLQIGVILAYFAGGVFVLAFLVGLFGGS